LELLIAEANFAALERPEQADRRFQRMSAAWQTSSNDRSAALRSAKQLAAVDP